jgi:hypothetical protein
MHHKEEYMKKFLVIAMVLFCFVVTMKDGRVFLAKKIMTGRFQWITLILSDTDPRMAIEITVPREDVKDIQKTTENCD